MRKFGTTFLAIVAATLLTGSSCNFSARVAKYGLASCPSGSFDWPKSVKLEDFEIEKETKPNPTFEFRECENLVRYHVKKKADVRTGLSHFEWVTYDLYLTFSKSSTCELFVGFPALGPNATAESKEKSLEIWSMLVDPVIRGLFEKYPLGVKFPVTSISQLESKAAYKSWCSAADKNQ